MDIRYEILRTLRESRDSISGQELSRQLGITRTAVWKHIRALEEEGYEIEAVNRKGYRLAGVPDTIAAREVESRLETKRMGKEICYFSTIGSTNQYAKKIAEEGAADGTLVIADEQTDGRGRSGRHWVTPPAQAISFTLILRPNLAPEKISMITLVMGLIFYTAYSNAYEGEKRRTLDHFSLIYARESLTCEFFLSLGLSNIVLLPDPAFVLQPEHCQLPDCFDSAEVIGINISKATRVI
jgi:biotin operon repressor BirA-like protein